MGGGRFFGCSLGVLVEVLVSREFSGANLLGGSYFSKRAEIGLIWEIFRDYATYNILPTIDHLTGKRMPNSRAM